MPASNPDDAQDKWERKTEGAADKWEANVQNPSRSVAEGLAEFWGGNEGDFSDLERTWDEEVQDAIDNNRFEENVRDKGDKWRRAAERGARNANR